MIGLIVLGLAFLFFLVVAYFSAKTWQLGHVVGMAFLFLFSLLLLFLTATLFRTYEKYQPAYEKSMVELAQAKQQHQRLMSGNGGPAGEGTLKGEQLLARMEQFGRGRVWRNVYGRFAPGNPEIGLVMANWNNDGCLAVGDEEDLEEPIDPVPDEEFAEEDPAEEESAEADPAEEDGLEDGAVEEAAEAEPTDEAIADAAEGPDSTDAASPPAPAGPVNPHGISEGQFVYAFKEFPISMLTPAEKAFYFAKLTDGEENFADTDTRGRCRVPIVYLGKFRVTKQTPGMITVLPESKLDPFQRKFIANNFSWVLYEQLPPDSHHLFQGVEAEQLSAIVPLKRLNDFGLRISPPAYQAMLQEYLRDGKETQPTNNPMRMLVELQFKQPYEVVVDFDVEGALPETNQPYNVEGRAQLRSLIQGAPTQFAEGDTALFDAVTAERLVRQGIAERVGNPIYNRRLRDFAFELHDQETREDKLAKDLAEVNDALGALKASLDRLQGQTDKLRLETGKLQQDLTGFDAERTSLGQYLRLLRQRAQYLRSEIERLTEEQMDGLARPQADAQVALR